MPTGKITLDHRKVFAMRKKHCLTQEGLANRSGISKRTIESIEKGTATSLRTAAAIAAVFGVPPSSLYVAEDAGPAKREGNAPAMPSLLVGRDRDIEALREQMLVRLAESQVASEMARLIVRGWAGVGKTTIARAFAHDEGMQSVFAGGVLWTSLGKSPSIRSELAGWCQSLSIEVGESWTEKQISQKLAGVLSTRAMLIIIDDVWTIGDASKFLIGGRNCATLLTTRSPSVADSLSSKEGDIYNLDILSEVDALELLAVLAPDVVGQFKAECSKLVSELECLPLALQVAGRLLRIEFRRTGDVKPLIEALHEDAQQILAAPVPADVYELVGDVAPTVVALFNRSTDMLTDESKERFALLAGFVPKPAIFGEDHLSLHWRTDDPVSTLRELIDFGLVEPIGERRYQVHALLIAHARSMCEE